MTMRPMATQSAYEMVSVAQAKDIIARFARPLNSESVNALDARGRVLAERIVSREYAPCTPLGGGRDMPFEPPMARCLERSWERSPRARARAYGGPGYRLTNHDGRAAAAGRRPWSWWKTRKNTIRWCRSTPWSTRAGTCIPQALDLSKGQVVFEVGTVLGPPEIGMLATMGHVNVSVYRRPRISMLATGDELVEPWEEPPYGAIRDSNRYAVLAAAAEASAAWWNSHVHDDEAATRSAIVEGIDADVLLTSRRIHGYARSYQAHSGRAGNGPIWTSFVQARETAHVRHGRRQARLRTPRISGVVSGHVRSLRAAGTSPNAGTSRS